MFLGKQKIINPLGHKTILPPKKPQILIAHHKEKIDRTQKSPAIQQKKFRQGLEDFIRVFGKLTTPYMMFESKKNSNSYCSSEGRNRSNPKKSSYSAKKVRLGFRGFRTRFLLLTTPYVMFEGKKNSNSYCSSDQKEEIDRTQKSPAIRQKKFGQGLKDFAQDSCC